MGLWWLTLSSSRFDGILNLRRFVENLDAVLSPLSIDSRQTILIQLPLKFAV